MSTLVGRSNRARQLLQGTAVAVAVLALGACGAVGAIDEQQAGAGDETLAQRALSTGLRASPSGDRVVFRTEALDGAVLVGWAKIQTNDIVALGWVGRVYRYQHTAAAAGELLQPRADQAELVVAGSVAPGAQIGLVRFEKGGAIAPHLLTIHGFDAATRKVSYSVTACTNELCDNPPAPTKLEVVLDTPVELEGHYRLGFQANAAAPSGPGVVFGLSRTDGRVEGCGTATLQQCRNPVPVASPSPTPAPIATAPAATTPAASPAPAAQPTPTEPAAPAAATTPVAPAAQPVASKDDDDDDDDGFFSTKNQLKWLGIAAVVGVGAYVVLKSLPEGPPAPVEARGADCVQQCQRAYPTADLEFQKTGNNTAALGLDQCLLACPAAAGTGSSWSGASSTTGIGDTPLWSI
jgi:hypothetical protein